MLEMYQINPVNVTLKLTICGQFPFHDVKICTFHGKKKQTVNIFIVDLQCDSDDDQM